MLAFQPSTGRSISVILSCTFQGLCGTRGVPRRPEVTAPPLCEPAKQRPKKSLLSAKATVTAGDVCARGLGPRGTDPAKPGPPGKVPVWRRRPRAAPWSPGTQRSDGRIRSLRRKRFRRGSLRTAVCVVSEESTRTRARAHTHTHTHTLTHDALALLAPDYNSTGFGDKRWRQLPRMKAFACVRVQTWLLPFAWALEESKRFRWKEISLSMFYAAGQTREGPTATHAGSLGPRGGRRHGPGQEHQERTLRRLWGGGRASWGREARLLLGRAPLAGWLPRSSASASSLQSLPPSCHGLLPVCKPGSKLPSKDSHSGGAAQSRPHPNR